MIKNRARKGGKDLISTIVFDSTFQEKGGRVENIAGEPINEGRNGELLKKAKASISLYNNLAAHLSLVVKDLLLLKDQLNDPGLGKVIVSGGGWQANALESIPMLRFRDDPFPPLPKAGMFHNTAPGKVGLWLDENNSKHVPSGGSSFSERETAEDLTRRALEFVDYEADHGRTVNISAAVKHVRQTGWKR